MCKYTNIVLHGDNWSTNLSKLHKNFSFSLSSNGLLWYKRTFYGTNGLDVRPGPSVIFDGLRTGLGLEFLGPVRVRSEVRRADPGGLSVAADST